MCILYDFSGIINFLWSEHLQSDLKKKYVFFLLFSRCLSYKEMYVYLCVCYVYDRGIVTSNIPTT